jgi:hypothetical protein
MRLSTLKNAAFEFSKKVVMINQILLYPLSFDI